MNLSTVPKYTLWMMDDGMREGCLEMELLRRPFTVQFVKLRINGYIQRILSLLCDSLNGSNQGWHFSHWYFSYAILCFFQN